MTFSNRGNYGGNRAQSSGGFNSRGSERPALHDAVCAKCGSACQVPFVPNGRKEVFCSRCFGEMNGGERDSRNAQRYERPDSRAPKMYDNRDGGSNFSDRQLFSAVCDECGDKCQVPFEPRNGNPVLCSNCFRNKKDGGNSRTTSFSKPSRDGGIDLEAVNAKLDKIIKMLSKETRGIEQESPKEITEKILEEIQIGTEKQLSTKKKTKTASKKKT